MRTKRISLRTVSNMSNNTGEVLHRKEPPRKLRPQLKLKPPLQLQGP
jgi:hypothetical protein